MKPLERYFQILELLAPGNESLALAEIASKLDLPGATAHRLVNGLVETGLVSLAPDEKRYVLGPRARRFGYSKLPVPLLREQFRESLDTLSGLLGQTVFLAKLNQQSVDVIIVHEPQGTGGAIVHPGRTLPLHAAASGKAILAFQPTGFIEAILSRNLAALAPQTKTDRNAILAELAEVRRDRFAQCDNEVDLGVLSYAAPIMAVDGTVIYSLGTCGLRDRFMETDRNVVREMLGTSALTLASQLSTIVNG